MNTKLFLVASIVLAMMHISPTTIYAQEIKPIQLLKPADPEDTILNYFDH